mmetsp:Transcript_13174/g.19009  ORF Transcript_13174/g.19009 Transcript_13174/m.19009 type:complete len:205 (-) Transcript_13174:50-664(-)
MWTTWRASTLVSRPWKRCARLLCCNVEPRSVTSSSTITDGRVHSTWSVLLHRVPASTSCQIHPRSSPVARGESSNPNPRSTSSWRGPKSPPALAITKCQIRSTRTEGHGHSTRRNQRSSYCKLVQPTCPALANTKLRAWPAELEEVCSSVMRTPKPIWRGTFTKTRTLPGLARTRKGCQRSVLRSTRWTRGSDLVQRSCSSPQS